MKTFWRPSKFAIFKKRSNIIKIFHIKVFVSILVIAFVLYTKAISQVFFLGQIYVHQTFEYLGQLKSSYFAQAQMITDLNIELEENKRQIAQLRYHERNQQQLQQENDALRRILNVKKNNPHAAIGRIISFNSKLHRYWIVEAPDTDFTKGDYIEYNNTLLGLITQKHGQFYQVSPITHNSTQFGISHVDSNQGYVFRGVGGDDGSLRFVPDGANIQHGDVITLHPSMTEDHITPKIGHVNRVEYLPGDYFINVGIRVNVPSINHSPFVTMHKKNIDHESVLDS